MNEQKRVLVVAPDLNGLGGIARVNRVLADSGVFEELNITYVESATDQEDVNQLLFFLKNLVKFILLLISGAEIVYVHTSSGRSFYRKSCFLLPAVVLRKKVILHIHPTHFYDFISDLSGFRKRFAIGLMGAVTSFVVLTEQMRDKISKMFPGKPVDVLRNPIEPELYGGSGNYHRKKNRLLYLGWYVRDKGVYDLVDAVEILEEMGVDFELNFYGRRGREELLRYVKEKGLSAKVSVEGWLYHDDKLEALYRSGILILPSYSEGIPNVILEAMVTGTPILSTAEGGLSEVLKDNHNAVITSAGDPKKLAADIAMMIEDDRLRNMIAENARHDVLEKYDIRIIRESFKNIIRSVPD